MANQALNASGRSRGIEAIAKRARRVNAVVRRIKYELV